MVTEMMQGWRIKGWNGKTFVLGKNDENVGIRIFVELRRPPSELSVAEVLRCAKAVREIKVLIKDITKEEIENVADKIAKVIQNFTKMYIINSDITDEGVGVVTIELSLFKWGNVEKLADQLFLFLRR